MTFAFDFTVTMGVIVTLAIAVIGWVHSNRKRTDDRISGLSDRIDRHENRLTGMEQGQRAMPSKDNMHELELTMSRLAGELSTMNEKLSGHVQIMTRLEATVSRHEDHLLKKS